MTAMALQSSAGVTSLIEGYDTTDLSSGSTYLARISRFRFLTAAEEHELAVYARENQGTENARKAAWVLVCSHLRLVVALARDFRGYGLPEDDLIQEGNVGLIKAVERFEPGFESKGKRVRLGTYATHWIKWAIGEYILKNWKIVRVATTTAQRKLFYSIRSAAARIGRPMTFADAQALAKEHAVRPKDVLEMKRRMLSTDLPYVTTDTGGDEDDTHVSAKVLVADGGAHAETIVVEDDVHQRRMQALREALATLTEREQEIVQARMLVDKSERPKLRELAARLGVSIERTRQLEKRALEKLERHVRQACPAA